MENKQTNKKKKSKKHQKKPEYLMIKKKYKLD